MVNLEKWEKVEFADLKKGDKVKEVIVTADGTKVESTGTLVAVDSLRAQSSYGWTLAKRHAAFNDETIYRRKPKPFKLPTTMAAVVSGLHKESEERDTLVWDGRYWNSSISAFSTDALNRQYSDFQLVRKGIKTKDLTS